MDITLLRIIDSLDRPTRGILFHYGTPLWTTLEPPNKHNVPFLSCIPEGVYKCRRQESISIGHKQPVVYPMIYEVLGVPGRSGIYIHRGNYKEDTQGCILIGLGFNAIGITESAQAFSDFMYELAPPKDHSLYTNFTLTVRFAR